MTPIRSKTYYAAIDLGSNSFHMLIVRVVAGSIQVVSKVKRKVRLAAGLTEAGQLSDDAKHRALACLRLFSDRVQDIAPENIRAVGTATLRKIQSDTDFLTLAQTTLGHPIQIISGEQEAATIYQGIYHTTAFDGPMLVIDIGGASTELVLGNGFEPHLLHSLDMGCVTWYERFFADGIITRARADAAIEEAIRQIRPVQQRYREEHWALALGASGTFRALQEIADTVGCSSHYQLPWLEDLLKQAVDCGHHDALKITGLVENRSSVFVSGLCILIALYRALAIDSLQTTNGALREGIIYGMLEQLQQQDVQLRTLRSLVANYHLDEDQSLRVSMLAEQFLQQLQPGWELPLNSYNLLRSAAYLHEIGLSLSYKHASTHAIYMLRHLDLPGFDQEQRGALIELLASTGGIIDEGNYPSERSSSQSMRNLARLLRLAIICCQRRSDSSMTDYRIHANDEEVELVAPTGFLQNNPFLLSLLEDEAGASPGNERLIIKEAETADAPRHA